MSMTETGSDNHVFMSGSKQYTNSMQIKKWNKGVTYGMG